MAPRAGPEPYDIVLRFGGGLNTRTTEDLIGEVEAADGQNFLLDVLNSNLRPRPPFDLVATAPNAGSIKGGGSFRKRDGTVKAFFQAGTTVYDFDGSSFDASPILDTVNANAELRGHWRSHTYSLNDLLLISDLSLNEPVKEWNGTTWQDITFLDNPSNTHSNAFYCKYIDVTAERAVYGHIKDGSTTFGHMIVGSERGDYTTISVNDRASESLGAADPFFLLTPDLRNINGMVQAFGGRIISSELGRIFVLAGNSADTFQIQEFYPGSYASGEEAMAYVGNDIVYGRQGRLESLRDTDKFGDTEANDLTRAILDKVKDYSDWRIVYNSRLNRVYCFPDGQSEVWVFDTSYRDAAQLSPWMRWRTTHSLAFQPTFVASMLDPADGLEYVFMGDSSGNVYRLEGTGAAGDGGTDTLQTSFTSRIFSLPMNMRASEIMGWIKYRRLKEAQVNIALLYAGENIYDVERIVTIPAANTVSYYGGGSQGAYYAGSAYYGGAFRRRFSRQRVEFPGMDNNEFQVRVTVDSVNDFDIAEIGLRFQGGN